MKEFGWIMLVLCIIASYIVPLIVFSTEEYDCLVFGATDKEILSIYQQDMGKAKVWVQENRPLTNEIQHFSMKARQIGGGNDIAKLMEDLNLKYVLLD